MRSESGKKEWQPPSSNEERGGSPHRNQAHRRSGEGLKRGKVLAGSLQPADGAAGRPHAQRHVLLGQASPFAGIKKLAQPGDAWAQT